MSHAMTHEPSLIGRALGGRPPLRRSPGFTLIELLVSITVLVVLMMVVTQVVGVVQRNWVRANSRVSQFREARRAFDVISRNLSQATLNTYWANDFDELSTDGVGEKITAPKSYKRQSELQFVSGPTSQVLTAAAGNDYPGHAVFFQAPLGVTSLVAADAGSTTQADTENMVNLLCARGYFVEWGTDLPYRPEFLNASPYSTIVPPRSRLRLMEYSPTAEKNRIYADVVRPIEDHSRQWFQDALTSTVTSTETVATRAFTRPIAENILALIISPQTETTEASESPTAIAPNYFYDSTVVGPTSSGTRPQGTQHALPPLLKVTMVALDERSGEFFARQENDSMRNAVLGGTAALFQNVASQQQELEGTDDQPGTLEQLLLENKLQYRIFTTTIALKASRFSF